MSEWIEANRVKIGWLMFAATFLLVGGTLTGPGVAWDEPWYFGSSQLQVLWVQKLLTEGPGVALAPGTVMEMWDWQHYYNPHPPLYKEWSAATWWATHALIGPLAAFRLAPALLFSGLVMLAFRWAAVAWSGIAGLAAGLSVLLQPRLFGHAHFAATEMPLMTFWFAATLAGWWAVERDRRMGWILAGICWGFAIGTKFTGLAAIGPVALYGLWRQPRRSATGTLMAAVVAVVVFSALNPMMWVAARQFLGRWVWESLHRADYVPILTFYLGRRYGFDVPWHHVFVMTAVVLPIAIALLAAVGGVAGLRRRDPVVILCAGTVVFVWMIFLLPRAPHHDGVRQFIMLFPFLGMLAGYGVHRATRVFGERVSGLILAVAFLPAAGQIAAYHPYYLSYYSEGVGGLRGAHAMGFETTYWQDAYTGPVLDFLNEELPQGSSVFVNGETLSLVFQQGIGRLRRDLRFTNVLPSDYVLAQMRRSTRGEDLIPGPEFGPPAYLLQHQGVPLVVIYRFRDGVIPEFGEP